MLGSEIFKEFYFPTEHSTNARYLFFGIDGSNALVGWIWTSILLNIGATVTLTLHPTRRSRKGLIAACIVLFVAIWMDKGMGLVIPGFVPSPLGEVVEYAPTWVELSVTAGIWAIGFFVFTALVRIALPIELGQLRSPVRASAEAEPAPTL